MLRHASFTAVNEVVRVRRPASPNGSAMFPILLVVATVSLYAVIDGLAKVMVQDMDVLQIIWSRFAFALPLLPVIVGRRWPELLRVERPGLQIARGLIPIVAGISIVVALRVMPLADATALMFVSPLMLTALAVPLLKEHVGLHRWSAVVIGFVGVLVIVRPGSTTMQWAALLPLLTAFLYALYQIATRVLSRTTPPLVTFAYMVAVGTAGSTLALPFVWRTPDALGWAMMAASGLLHGLAHYLVTRAFALAPAAILAPFNYAQLIGATAFGYFIFGDLPDRWTIVGALVIVGAGLYVAYRERRLARLSGTPAHRSS
jgi:drug/metabolite transporter (DMT)-like permease